MSIRLTVDLHVECIDATEGIDHVTIYILATLQWAKVSLATVLSTFIATLLLMTGNASIIVRIVENRNAFIILHLILDFLYLTT